MSHSILIEYYLLQADDLNAEATAYDTHSMPKQFQQVLPVLQ